MCPDHRLQWFLLLPFKGLTLSTSDNFTTHEKLVIWSLIWSSIVETEELLHANWRANKEWEHSHTLLTEWPILTSVASSKFVYVCLSVC